jgi:dienelactone hydrolase
MNKHAIPISQYSKSVFSAITRNNDTITHDVYEYGSGAPIVLIQELPGIGLETLKLAEMLLNQGFKVILPHLFGPIGKTSFVGNGLRVFCMRKEFRLFEHGKSSPIVDWLKALCQKVKHENKCSGVGVIGMCLTGNFAISLMADDSVLAAVASQPSLPPFNNNAVQLDDSELTKIKQKIDSSHPIQVLRFADDPLCSAHRQNAIRDKLDDTNEKRVEFTEIPGKGHSVLTLDFVDKEGHPTKKAFDHVVRYFNSQLTAAL